MLEFDRKCLTCQAEDFVQIYSDSSYSNKLFDRFSKSKWPPNALIVPGSSVSFDFQTASDYNERKRYALAFSCTVCLRCIHLFASLLLVCCQQRQSMGLPLFGQRIPRYL